MNATWSIACSLCDSWAYSNDAYMQYASIRTKWQLLKVLLGLTCDLFALTTVGQHFNWHRASRGSLSDSWASCDGQHSPVWILTKCLATGNQLNIEHRTLYTIFLIKCKIERELDLENQDNGYTLQHTYANLHAYVHRRRTI